MTLSLPGKSLIVASETYIDGLRATQALASSSLITLAPDAELPDSLLGSARVLVLEVDPSNDASLRRMAQVRVRHPDLTIVAALRQADVSLVRTLIRQGIADVADLPFSPEELSAQVLDCLSRDAALSHPADTAPLVTVLHANGGTGATTVLTHLAAALAATNTGTKGVCLVDLDIQGGDAASCLGVESALTVKSLLDAGPRLDEDLVRGTVSQTSWGFGLIVAPDAIAPLDDVDVDQVLRMIQFLRSMYDVVLVDLPAAWTDWTLSVVMASTSALLVTDTSIASLRHTRQRLDLLASVGMPKSRVGVVINRLERRLFRAIGTDDVSETLKCEVVAGLAAEPSALRAAQDQGKLLFETNNKCHFATDVRGLAETVLEKVRGDR